MRIVLLGTVLQKDRHVGQRVIMLEHKLDDNFLDGYALMNEEALGRVAANMTTNDGAGAVTSSTVRRQQAEETVCVPDNRGAKTDPF